MNVKSIKEARKKLDELGAVGEEIVSRVDELRTYLDQLSGFGRSLFDDLTDDAPASTTPTAAANGSAKSVPMPASWADRVLNIFKGAGGLAYTPKRVIEIYTQMGWELPEDDANGRKLYTKVLGSINYLTVRKKVLDKVSAGQYRLKT